MSVLIDPQVWHERLATLGIERIVVAVSGGIDSLALVHALAASRPMLGVSLRACHINHRLQPDAERWATATQAACARLDVPCDIRSVRVDTSGGDSLEAAARTARYSALAEWIDTPRSALMTAHHLEDQAETLLLALFRGAGPSGLAAMPWHKAFAAGVHLRPLLECPRARIEAYARAHALEWHEDPSNADARFDRNFIRHRLLAPARARWPAIARTIARSATACADANAILHEVATADLSYCAPTGADDTLDIERWRTLGPARQRQALRAWLARHHPNGYAPDAALLAHIVRDLIDARADRQPQIPWAGQILHRFAGALRIVPRLPACDSTRILTWSNPREPLSIAPLGDVRLVDVDANTANTNAGALRCARLRLDGSERLSVRFRRGAERLRPAGDPHHRTLKALFQRAAIPPWFRSRIPLLFSDERLIAVADLWIDADTACADGEPGCDFQWQYSPWSVNVQTRF